MTTSSFPSLLQRFFTERLCKQLDASPHTIASYRDTFRLLLRFAAKQLGQEPCKLRLEDLDASLLGKFLEDLEARRGNCPRTRNNRLSALHAFFRYAALSEPPLALHCQRVLAIPAKRCERSSVEFLTEEETLAIVTAPSPCTWIGRRDRALLLVAAQTGLRNSEIRSLRRQDVELGTGAHVRCLGKGRKTRCTPLRADVASVLKEWLAEGDENPMAPVFPSSQGKRLSPDALQRLLRRHVLTARRTCASLADKKVTPHTLRHAAAMDLLRRGVDLSVIALWLGHESTETTQVYLHADMRLKEQALGHATPSGLPPDRFRPVDELLSFLETL